MKKLIAVLTVLVLMVTAIIPAMAETNQNGGNQPPQSMNSGAQQGQNDKSGGNHGPAGKPDGASSGQQAPAKTEGTAGGDQNARAKTDGAANGKQAQSKTEAASGEDQKASARPDDAGNAGNAPEKPEGASDSENTSAKPEKHASGNESQNTNAAPEQQDPIQKLVTDGKLSRTTYDSIQEYMKNNSTAPEKPDGDTSGETQTPPEKPEEESSSDDNDQTLPARPEGDMAGAPQGQPSTVNMMPDQETLDAMLADGVITTDEYNVIIDVIEIPENPAVTDATESSEGI